MGDPVKYNEGLVGGFRTIIKEEGAMALTTGLGATAFGYFIQGWFKFGGVEFFKIKAVESMGEEKAWENKTAIYLGAAAAAEPIADGFAKMFKAEGVGGFYAGLGPILFKQIPYTMAKFAVQGKAADAIYGSMGKTPDQVSKNTGVAVSLGSGVIAGVPSAIISHPADTLLSKVNKAGAGGDGPLMSRMANIVKEVGIVNLCTVGLLPRCIMIGTLTAGQFGIFDTVINALGASKFHFTNPNKH